MGQRLSIVVIRAGSPYSLDGINTFIYNLCEGFIKLGNEVNILGGYGDSSDSVLRLEIQKLFGADFVPEVYTLEREKLEAGATRFFKYVTLGTRIIRSLDPDFVVLNGTVPLAYYPRINVLHDPPSFGSKLITRAILSMCSDALVATSGELKKRLSALGFSRISVIPPCLNIEKYNPRIPRSRREKTILHIGTNKRKNLLATLKAFSKVLRENPDTKLYVVGSQSDYLNACLDSIERKIMDKVSCVGKIAKDEQRNLYSRSKVLSIPSFYEGFGYPVLEAFASGTPVIGSTTIPKSLLRDGYNGFRVKPTNHESLAEKLITLLNSQQTWKCMSNNALKTAEIFSCTKIAQKFVELYESLEAS